MSVFGNNPADYQKYLMSAIGFTDADLKSNRVGRLSEQQRQDLQRDQSHSAVKWWIMIGVSALFLFLGLSNPILGQICISYATPIFLLALAAAFLEQNKVRKITRQGRVNILQGVLGKRGPQNTLQKNSAKSTVRYIYMEGRRFTVSQGVYDALDEDALYRLYFVESTGFLKGRELKLLAAEWLDEDEVLGRLDDSAADEQPASADSLRRRTPQRRA